MVSFSPIDAINRRSSLRLGLITWGTCLRQRRGGDPQRQRRAVPGRSGADPSSASRRTRSGRASAYHMRPGPAHRVAGERRRLQPQLVEDLVDELDGRVPEALARNVSGLAQPEPRPVDGDRAHALEPLEHREERERGRVAAVQEHDRRALARLDDMDASALTGARSGDPGREGRSVIDGIVITATLRDGRRRRYGEITKSRRSRTWAILCRRAGYSRSCSYA